MLPEIGDFAGIAQGVLDLAQGHYSQAAWDGGTALASTIGLGAVVRVAQKATQLEFGFAKDVTEVHYLYQKVSATGEHLKFGVTDDLAGRYTAARLNGGRLKPLAQGSREEMLRLERNLHETLPLGPEEGQQFYIQMQIRNKLLAPSQYPFPP